MFKNVLLSFILVIFSNQAFALDLEAPTQTPVKLSITTDQEAEVKRIYDFFIQDLGKKTEDYQFAIEESDVLNAYATLGKKIIVTTGLIKKLQSEAGLAFVIAHELGHVEQKHVLKGLFRNTIGALIQMFFFKEQNTANTVYQGANFLHSKYYSRSKEKKADLFAVELVNKHYCKAAGKI